MLTNFSIAVGSNIISYLSWKSDSHYDPNNNSHTRMRIKNVPLHYGNFSRFLGYKSYKKEQLYHIAFH